MGYSLCDDLCGRCTLAGHVVDPYIMQAMWLTLHNAGHVVDPLHNAGHVVDPLHNAGHVVDPYIMQAMWLMMQRDKPEDYVIATGETHSVRELVELAFQEVGMEIVYVGRQINYQGVLSAMNTGLLRQDVCMYLCMHTQG